jgi:hypothetical protein
VRVVAAVACVLLVAGCASVARPFVNLKPDFAELPADSMRAVAAEIEAAVRQGNREPDIADRDGIVVNTPEIQQALRTRAARYEILNELLASGFAFENRKGLVEIRSNREYEKATTRRERARHAQIVLGENQNRWALYEGFLDSSNLSNAALDAIQRIFYEERIKLLPEGQKYEDDSGNVVTKGGA